ncbi:helix-turn-helix transcriptional regulator [Kitasatospora sp. NPDC050543]|uniref:helix-turn-helix transcriptional regulator n=1 Tax=Kitasatospora sp. NPDC050543 TaxID=3364054 RepID=UPI0037880DDA
MPGAEAAQVSLSLQIRAFINEHLPDPGLSPDSIARAHHVSVRYLHKLFQHEGTSVHRWIQQRRLEEARRELSKQGRAAVTIASVAHRWGFVDPAHFSRSFRAAYGMTPREWRECGRTAGEAEAGPVRGASLASTVGEREFSKEGARDAQSGDSPGAGARRGRSALLPPGHPGRGHG